jgi:hypothetical protein
MRSPNWLVAMDGTDRQTERMVGWLKTTPKQQGMQAMEMTVTFLIEFVSLKPRNSGNS